MATIDEAEAWLRAGRAREACDAAGELLRREPGSLRALVVRANAAIALREHDAAAAALQRLLAARPGQAALARALAGVLNQRGRARRAAGDLAGALADLRDAVAQQPDHPQAWFNLALAAQQAGAGDEARAAIARHLAAAPDDLEAHRVQASLAPPAQARAFLDALAPAQGASLEPGALALLAARSDRPAIALDALARLQPADDLAAATAAVVELAHAGEAASARLAAAPVIAVRRAAGRSSWRAELAGALALPTVYDSLEHLAQARAAWFEGLKRLEADWSDARLGREAVALRDLAHGNFLLAYQGQDDTRAQVRYARLLQRAAVFAAPALAAPPTTPRRGRVGLLSSGWRTCTVGSYFGGWIGWLRAAGLEVHLYQLGPQQDAYTAQLAAQASTFRLLEGPLEAIAQQVRDDELDLLLYPELGMDARLLPLAALRLARRQVVAWGHPVTSGFASIDDFLTCGEMEPPDAAAHYRERLVALPGLGVDYRRPDAPPAADAASLGLDPARPRVLVPQSLFKLHPDGDAVLAAIATGAPTVQLVCFAPERAPWWQRFHGRLQRAFAARGLDLDRHLLQLPLGSRARYLQVNRACDLMLDSLHWSGGNTALDALCSGLPLVTCPGHFMRGRQSLAMLQRLGLSEALSTPSAEAQAGRVLQLIDGAAERRELGATIAARLPALFDAAPAQAAFVAWAQEAAAG